MSTTKHQSKKNSRKKSERNSTLYWIVGGVIGLGLIVWLAFSIASDPGLDESIGFGDVTVEGDPLPFLADGATQDPAVGLTAPTVSGHDWEGNEYTIGPDGTPKILVFLAHWCPHCQAEVPVIQDWVDSGGLGDQVGLYGLTVLTNRLQGNWPPQEWLEDEGWSAPTIMDDEESSAVFAYGMRGTPFYVVLDGENQVLARLSGEIGTAGLEALESVALGDLGG